MPSACIKPEKKASGEADDAFKQVIVVVDKKVRNLEKRKGKLELYREKRNNGDVLNEDQREAIGNYDSVVRNLEFARELQKQFSEIHEKAEKLLKKKAKYEKQDRHNEEVARMQELLQVQNLLDSMGVESVREDFKTGKKGAVILSEESLNQLDELYKLISPSRDGEVSYTDQLTQASEHIVNFLDAKEKEVAGTTYKNLKDLIKQINDCGYFDKTQTEVEEETPVEQEEQEETVPEEVGEPVQQQQQQQEVVQPVEPAAMSPQPTQTQHVHQTSPAQTYEEPQPQMTTTAQTELPTQQTLPASLQTPQTQAYDDQDSFFTTVQMPRPRGFQEIVSSVQGSFNFLQDSELESQQKAKQQQQQQEALQMDPAVVVAHSSLASGSLHQSTADPLSQSYGSTAGPAPVSYLDDSQTSQFQQQPAKNQSTSVTDNSLTQSQAFADSMSAQTQPQSSQYGQSSSYETTTQESSWGAAETRWGSTAESIDRSWGDQASSGGTAQSWGDQAPSQTAWSTAGGQGPNEQVSQTPDAPEPIPMPPSQPSLSSHSSGAHQVSLTGPSYGTDSSPSFSQVTSNNQETKTSSLNPNADIFSMYSSQSQNYSQEGVAAEYESSSQMTSKPDRFGQSDMSSGGYQSQGYRRNYDNRGGPRSGRGGQRGGGMSNGYSRGGNRGGYRGDDRRGGYNDRGSRGGNRGGPSFQGYPPRSNYQPEGFQGVGNGFGFESGSGFGNKRGGQRGGGMRGGQRGGSGGGRGGGNRGNYSRPSSAQHQ